MKQRKIKYLPHMMWEGEDEVAEEDEELELVEGLVMARARAGKRVGELQPHFGQPVTPSLSMGPAIFIGQSQTLHDGEFSSQMHRRQPFVTSILYCLQLMRQKTTGHSGVAGGDDKSKRKNMCKYFTMQIKVNKGLIFDTKFDLLSNECILHQN